ncbi:uncharacterized protein LOC125225387 [Leguminivora glycinivorella]|uniref:uncharacterized protein LOC125225387 n=1 Tax=Leguminivora glycinivorella TaxID=1035111 RepID=UPI00200FC362|nr:uncharacterized protein LOC125225387 [Leguminivora glycinivorella]
MYKSLVLLCVVYCVVVEARPKWQFLPPVPGYVPVYIRTGDTPLEEINPDLAEAFHALPAGRSAGKELEAAPEMPEVAPETPELADQPELPEQPEKPSKVDNSPIDHRPYEKKKSKKASSEIAKPIERR